MKLYELSIKKPVAVVMAVMIAVVLGLYSMTMLDKEMMPDIKIPYILVSTSYSGVAPSEIETMVSKPIESAVSAVSGIKNLYSTSNEGSSIVYAEFNASTDLDKAAQDIKDKLDLLEEYLPDDCDKPIVMKLDMNSMPVAMFSFSIDGYNLTQTKKYVEDNVSKKLEAVDGVASVSVTGATDREIQVVVDSNKLFGYNISLSQLVSSLASENQDTSVGNVSGMGKSLAVRSVGKFSSLKDIEGIPITTATGQTVYIRDVADVVDGQTEATTYARLNGENALSISIQKQSDANTVDVVNGVIKVLDDLKAKNDKVNYNMTMEQASYIENALSSVANNAVTGAFLAVLILLLFLGSFRSSLVIGVAMPTSIFTTFVGMYFSGMSLNVVSLGGLALGVGMLVDNSVVVLENIYRRRTSYKEDGKTAGIKGTAEVVGAVIASVITTCIVYVPLLFVDNIMANMFNQLSLTIIFSQISSMIITFLLVPMLSSRISNIKTSNKFKDIFIKPFDKFLSSLYVVYEKTLRFALNHRKTVVATVLVLFVGSLGVLALLGMELMPASDEGSLTISVEAPQGSELSYTDQLTKNIEQIVSKNQYVKTIFSSVGGSESFYQSASKNKASMTVTLVDKKERKNISTNDVVELIRQDLANVAGAKITISATSSTGMSSSNGVDFYLLGDDLDALKIYANQAKDILKNIDGTREVTTSLSDTKPEARVYVDREKAAKYGLTASSASALIKTALSGQVATQYAEDGKEYDVRVKLPDSYTDTYENLKELKIKSATGWISAADIADIMVENGYNSIDRYNQKRRVTVSAKIYGSDIGTVTNKFYSEFSKITPPEGCSYEAGGDYERMMNSMIDLLKAILLGILLMYMVMAAQFGSYVEPLLVLLSVPLSVIGVVAALAIDGHPLNVISVIGMLMLSGMIVNNAIVLIEFINTAKEEGGFDNREDLVVYAGKTRMRPVLMTTVTSVLGFLPMVLSSAEGSEMLRPLSVVLLGGLSIGTLLTLIFIPTIYTISDDILIKRKEKKAAKKAAKAKECIQG
ncbi:MAG: efflux RND transporter permease subunit [Clostridia bacterium]|nr:efflux RND transporter permease subunit [Clostridia bacterium]